jgi:hypothetical protein
MKKELELINIEQQITTRRKRIAEANIDSAQKKPRLLALIRGTYNY